MTPIFINDGRRWINAERIETIIDLPSMDPQRPERLVRTFGKQDLTSPGTAGGLLDALNEAVARAEAPGLEFDDFTPTMPGRRVDDGGF